jgi:hypothetical protein
MSEQQPKETLEEEVRQQLDEKLDAKRRAFPKVTETPVGTPAETAALEAEIRHKIDEKIRRKKAGKTKIPKRDKETSGDPGKVPGKKTAGKSKLGEPVKKKKKPAVSRAIAKQLQRAPEDKKKNAKIETERAKIDQHFRRRQLLIYVAITVGTILLAAFIVMVSSGKIDLENLSFSSSVVPAAVDNSTESSSPGWRKFVSSIDEMIADAEAAGDAGKLQETIFRVGAFGANYPADKAQADKKITAISSAYFELTGDLPYSNREGMPEPTLNMESADAVLGTLQAPDRVDVAPAIDVPDPLPDAPLAPDVPQETDDSDFFD